MRKSLILLTGILIGCLPGLLFAGINPNNVGLVTVNVDLVNPSNDCNFYSQGLGTAVANNNGSVMCVACHTRNPANITAPDLTKNANHHMAGSHFVTGDFKDTNRGGGYSDGRGARNATGTYIYMAKNPPIGATGWRNFPRYGKLAANGTIDNDIIADGAANLDGAQMICYSCHSMKYNTSTNARLLANGARNDNAFLCISCHGDMDAEIAAEWEMHPGPAGTWGSTHHHRNSHSVDADTYYKGSVTQLKTTGSAPLHNMGVVDENYYGQARADGKLMQMWAAGKGMLTGSHDLRWTGDRMVGAAPNSGSINPTTNKTGVGGGTLICTNCHAGHFGESSTGATVLLRGGTVTESVKMASGVKPLAVSSGGSGNTGYEGVKRMNERGGRAATFNVNTNPNCLTCHK